MASKIPTVRLGGALRLRLLFAACAAGVLALALTPVVNAQEIVKFAATDSAAQSVNLRAELFRPEGTGPFPAVILMHGCGGWQPAVHYSLDEHAEFLAKHGYVVLNLDSFGPRHLSGSLLCASNVLLRAALGYRASDAFSAMRYLRNLAFIDARNVFLMGQSNGGSVALEAASVDGQSSYDRGGTRFRAVVAYYPWCGVFVTTERLVSPLLIFAGGQDDWVSASECEQLKVTGADLQVRVYPEAVHSFDVDILPEEYLGHRIGYDESAAIDSEQRMLHFFDDHLTADVKSRLVAAASQLPQ